MNYEDALKYIYERLPMFQRVGAAAYKADLKKTIEISRLLGEPHHHFSSIHIAGTNGKGSTAHLLASILQCKGLKTGLYTSPHLTDFRERIQIDGKKIPKSWVSQFLSWFKKDFEKIEPSFFEMTFGMAIRYFKEEKIDIAILETGMGGRLDSTNIIHPLISAITNIGMDHSAFLGDSLEMIATEKAGIIKTGIPCVIGKHQATTDEIFEYKANLEDTGIVYANDTYSVKNLKEAGATNTKLLMDIYRNDKLFIHDLRCPLTGRYQTDNIVTTLKIIDELIKLGYDIRKNHILKGINDVVKQTGIRGRWQIIGRNPLVVCDTAHNEDGIRAIVKQIRSTTFEKLHFILSVVNDKDITTILKLLPSEARYYFCKANIPRGLNTNILFEKAKKTGLKGVVYGSVSEAYKEALEKAAPEDMIFAGGSTFTVAEIL